MSSSDIPTQQEGVNLSEFTAEEQLELISEAHSNHRQLIEIEPRLNPFGRTSTMRPKINPNNVVMPEAKEQMRVGRGITDIDTLGISPQVSGRLTLAMLQKMQQARTLDAQFADKEENEFEKIKKLMLKEKKLKQKRIEIVNALEQHNLDVELKKQLLANDKEKKNIKKQLIIELKNSFKHMTGMWPNSAKFEIQEQRMDSWQTDSVIKQKIFEPAKTPLICDQGAFQLENEQLKYGEFLQTMPSRGCSSRSNSRNTLQLRSTFPDTTSNMKRYESVNEANQTINVRQKGYFFPENNNVLAHELTHLSLEFKPGKQYSVSPKIEKKQSASPPPVAHSIFSESTQEVKEYRIGKTRQKKMRAIKQTEVKDETKDNTRISITKKPNTRTHIKIRNSSKFISQQKHDRLKMLEILKKPKICVNGRMESLKQTIFKTCNKISAPSKNDKRLGFNTDVRRTYLSPVFKPQQNNLQYASASLSQGSDSFAGVKSKLDRKLVNRSIDVTGLDVHIAGIGLAQENAKIALSLQDPFVHMQAKQKMSRRVKSKFNELRITSQGDRPSITRIEKSRTINMDLSPGIRSITSGQSASRFSKEILEVDQIMNSRRNTTTKNVIRLNPIPVKDLYLPNQQTLRDKNNLTQRHSKKLEPLQHLQRPVQQKRKSQSPTSSKPCSPYQKQQIEALFLLKPEIIDRKIKKERRRLGKMSRRLGIKLEMHNIK